MKKIYILILLVSLLTNFSLFAQKQAFSCGVKDNNLSQETLKAMRMAPKWLAEKKGRKNANDFYVCRLGIDIDSDTYNYFEKDTNRIKFEVIKTIERVSKIFEAEINTQLVITHINIWKDPKKDPYNGIINIFRLLNIAYDLWKQEPFKNLEFDRVMYLSIKPFVGAGGVAVEYINVSPFNDFKVIAHELGHNFGSPHTHSCEWPGGALDFCYPTEGDCYQNSIEFINGTIMSYCLEKLTFHPLCQALMQNHAETNLKKLDRIDKAPILPDTIRHDGNPFLLFNPAISAEDYYYEVSQAADFSKIISADSSSVNAIPFASFRKNTTYYLRIKARNRLGISPWSNTATIVISDSILLPPVLKAPENSVKNKNNIFLANFDQSHILPFELDKDATQYEVAVYDQSNNFFSLMDVKYFVRKNSNEKFALRPFDFWMFNTFYWRVRAINGNTKSAWSELQKIDCLQKEDMVEFPVYKLIFEPNAPMPVNFPIFYRGNDEMYDIKFTISTNSNFTNPVTEKLVKSNKYFITNSSDYSIMSGTLSPDTDYFLKVESIPPSPDHKYLNSGPVFKTIIKKFRTTGINNDNQYKILVSDNTPNIGRTFKTILPGHKGVFVSSEQGIAKVDIHKLNATMYDRDNTNGIISNTSGYMTTDSLGNLWTIAPLSKIVPGHDNIPDKIIYALRKFDKNTMTLLSSQEFIRGDDLLGNFFSIDPDNQLIITDYQIGRIEQGVLNPLLFVGEQFQVTDVVKTSSYLWINGIDRTQSRLTVKRYNRTTKEIKDITYGPEYNITSIAVDSDENLWADINEIPGVAKYDGNSWTVYNSDNSILPARGTLFGLTTDRFNNVYVAMQLDNRVFQFNGKEWRVLDDFSRIGLDNIQVDQSGKIWSIIRSNVLVQFDPCNQIIKPEIVNNSVNIELDKPMILEAKGCNSAIWGWESKAENVYEKLVSGTNKIQVTPKGATTYHARCYDKGCSGEEATFSASFNILRASKVAKNQVCEGDSVTVIPEIEAQFGSANQLSVLLSSAKTNIRISLSGKNGRLSFKTDSSVPVGKYWLKIASTHPELISKDSIEIEILSTPTVSIMGRGNICPGQSISLIATGSKGIEPYTYQWKINSTLSPRNDSIMTNLDKPGNIVVKAIDSKGCVSNEATLNITKSNFDNLKISAIGPVDLVNNASVALSTPLVSTYTYQWYRNNQAIQGAVSNGFTTTQAGSYMVKASEKGCSGESNVIEVTVITAHEPLSSEPHDLKVFPNPGEGNFLLEFNLSDNIPLELKVFDITGKTIWQKTIRGIGSFREHINLTKYPAGTYLLVGQKDTSKQTIKLEKQ